MAGSVTRWYANIVSSRSKTVILLVLVLTALVGAGAAVGEMEDAGFGEFDVETEETRAGEFVQENYAQQDGVISQIVVRDEGGNALTKESMRESLALQQEVANDETLGETLDGDGFVGIENIVARTAFFDGALGGGLPPTGQPTLDEQKEALDALDEDEFDAVLTRVLEPDGMMADQDPYQFLPESYEPGETTADARLTLLLQVDESEDDADPEAAYDAQVEIAELLDERFDDAFIFGQGISSDASAQATGDSFAIITPLALVIILLVLGIAYRDVLDILLAFLGISAVMVWLAGIMGWLAIPMNVILIAVPFLLIGLSIDYALHVVMRYREARSGRLDAVNALNDSDAVDEDGQLSEVVTRDLRIRAAMTLGLGSVILAIAAATFSTGVGFFSNVVSPLPAIRDFAILSAGGIFATFIIFGALLPALKVELDSFIETRLGRSREKPAFGVGQGVANTLLSGIASLASRTPLLVILVAFLLATGGAYGATTIDTEFNEADFLPANPPEWTSNLPGPLQPGTYTVADDFAYLSENFRLQGEDDQSQLLIRGDVSDDAVLGAIDTATQDIDDETAFAFRPDGEPAIDGPHTVLREVADSNTRLADAIDERDTTGNDLPDEDVEEVYELLFEIDEEAASQVLSRDEDGITSARLLVSVRSGESTQTIAEDTRALGTAIQHDAPAVTVVATGEPVTEAVIENALFDNLVEAFSITLLVILVFLTLLFWRRYDSPSLGAVILAPVVAALAWLFGAMAILDIPFNSETAVFTSLAIGLGVDYSIHAGERFIDERERHDTLGTALENAITGTGGALLASAATTAAAFGVLALSLSPPLQRFGLVTGSAIVLAFFACVTVLPCLLVVRERVKERFA